LYELQLEVQQGARDGDYSKKAMSFDFNISGSLVYDPKKEIFQIIKYD